MTEVQINRARDEYRLPPAEAARLWFVVADLAALHPMYTASLAGFTGMIRHCIKVSWETMHGQRHTVSQSVWGLVQDTTAPPSLGALHLAQRR